jgi:hypothetical protein
MTMQEFNFDKFIADIEKRDADKKRIREESRRDDDSALSRKELQRRYQEKPGNRIRYNK